ncbi:MAG: GTPase Era [Rhodospirillaceae bacterium]|nr:GTPase Era [Rhodospirillaceae bacterium]
MSGPGALEPLRRCGYVAVIGAPNAGKSTLVNAIVGTKVAIVTPKVQTTRSRVLGITVLGDSQVICIDTPGIFQPKRRLERAMVAAAWQGAGDADVVLVLVDAARPTIDPDAMGIVERLKDAGRDAILALNKVDVARRTGLLAMSARLNGEGIFTDTFMISALTGDGLADLKACLAGRVPAGPWLYPEDDLTDLPMRLMAAEVTREKLFLHLHQELPYALTVETETWEPFEDGSLRLGQVIHIQRDNQKAIVLGKGGRMIKRIGSEARAELEDLLDCRVHLKLFVRVREGWIDDPDQYRPWGLDYNA